MCIASHVRERDIKMGSTAYVDNIGVVRPFSWDFQGLLQHGG